MTGNTSFFGFGIAGFKRASVISSVGLAGRLPESGARSRGRMALPTALPARAVHLTLALDADRDRAVVLLAAVLALVIIDLRGPAYPVRRIALLAFGMGVRNAP